MRIPRIYCAKKLQLNKEVILNHQASTHVLHVLRLKLGAQIILFNGMGGEYNTELTTVTKQQAIVKITAFIDRNAESPLRIYLAQGISRGEKMDYTIQKAVELGVYKIIPIFTERCNVKLDQERLEHKIQHWQKIAISACEQCGRNYIPAIASATTFTKWLEQEHQGQCLTLYHNAAKTLTDIDETMTNATLLVGPEGGLTDLEIQQSQQQHFTPIKFGPRIMRTETAALAAITALQTRWGDLCVQ